MQGGAVFTRPRDSQAHWSHRSQPGVTGCRHPCPPDPVATESLPDTWQDTMMFMPPAPGHVQPGECNAHAEEPRSWVAPSTSPQRHRIKPHQEIQDSEDEEDMWVDHSSGEEPEIMSQPSSGKRGAQMAPQSQHREPWRAARCSSTTSLHELRALEAVRSLPGNNGIPATNPRASECQPSRPVSSDALSCLARELYERGSVSEEDKLYLEAVSMQWSTLLRSYIKLQSSFSRSQVQLAAIKAITQEMTPVEEPALSPPRGGTSVDKMSGPQSAVLKGVEELRPRASAIRICNPTAKLVESMEEQELERLEQQAEELSTTRREEVAQQKRAEIMTRIISLSNRSGLSGGRSIISLDGEKGQLA